MKDEVQAARAAGGRKAEGGGRAGTGGQLRQCAGMKNKLPMEEGILNELWTLYAETHMAGVFGGLNDAYSAQGVQAGIVATLLTALPEAQFREVMIRWEVDAIRLTQLLHIAGVWTEAGSQRSEVRRQKSDGRS